MVIQPRSAQPGLFWPGATEYYGAESLGRSVSVMKYLTHLPLIILQNMQAALLAILKIDLWTALAMSLVDALFCNFPSAEKANGQKLCLIVRAN